MEQIRVGVAQLTSVDDSQKNLEQILELLKKVESQNVHIVFFPENSLYLRIQEGAKIPPFELSDSVFHKLQDWVDRFQCALHLGSVPIREGAKLLNATVWLEPGQKPRVSYVKLHLFDIELTGQKPIRESDVFEKGSEPRVLEYKGWKWGQTICYDLRFSNLFYEYAKQGVDALLVPSAFLKTTGEAHWEVLLRARAIESQAYVIASAQGGEHRNSTGIRTTYGHGLVVDPWGRKLLEIDQAPDLQILDLNKREIQSVRRQIPMSNHRRILG